MSRRKRRLMAMALMSCIGVGTIAAVDYVVHRDTVLVRSGKGTMYPVVGQFHLNDTLPSPELGADGWIHLQVNGKDGYVKDTALAAPTSLGINSLAQSGTVGGSARTTDVGATAAAPGLRDEAQAFALDMHYDPSTLSRMLDSRHRVEGQPWLDFTYAKRLNPYKNYKK